MLQPLPSAVDSFFAPFVEAMGLNRGLAEAVQLWTLGYARWLPITSLTPFLGGKLVPNPIRISIAGVFALWMVPWMNMMAPPSLDFHPVYWTLLLLREAGIGMLIGLGAGIVFYGAEMGGRFLDNTRGTTSGSVMVPQIKEQSSILGDFYYQLLIIFYVLIGGPQIFLTGVFESYHFAPPFELTLAIEYTALTFIAATAETFRIAFKLVGPAIAIVMLTDILLGVANRMAPQLQVFFLSMPLKSVFSSVVIALCLYFASDLTKEIFISHHQWYLDMVRALAGNPS